MKSSVCVSDVCVFHTGLQQQGIFRVPGSQVEVNDIKNAFERGESRCRRSSSSPSSIWNCVWFTFENHNPLPGAAAVPTQSGPVCVATTTAYTLIPARRQERNSVTTCSSLTPCDECVITAQVRIRWPTTRRTRTSTQWPESWSSTSGAWKTRCSPRSDSSISYPPPVSLFIDLDIDINVVDYASFGWHYIKGMSRLTHRVSQWPGICWNPCAHTSSAHSLDPSLHNGRQRMNE